MARHQCALSLLNSRQQGTTAYMASWKRSQPCRQLPAAGVPAVAAAAAGEQREASSAVPASPSSIDSSSFKLHKLLLLCRRSHSAGVSR